MASSRRSGRGRRYGKKASKKVERAMHEMKAGTLRSGGSGRKVKNPRQAIAIGLSEARREGDQVPPPRAGRSRRPRRRPATRRTRPSKTSDRTSSRQSSGR